MPQLAKGFQSEFGVISVEFDGVGRVFDVLPDSEAEALLQHIVDSSSGAIEDVLEILGEMVMHHNPLLGAEVAYAAGTSSTSQGSTIAVKLSVKGFRGAELPTVGEFCSVVFQALSHCVLHTLDDPSGEKMRAKLKEQDEQLAYLRALLLGDDEPEKPSIGVPLLDLFSGSPRRGRLIDISGLFRKRPES